MSVEKIHPLIRLLKYIQNNPTKRSLELQSGVVWLKSEYGVSAVYGPNFDEIIAPTHDNNKPLF